MLNTTVLCSVLLLATVLPPTMTDLDTALDASADLVAQRRYGDVLKILEPFAALDNDDDEAAYILAAEIGRCHFHLGDYRAADREFRRAVAIHPERVETALYLQATSYLLGHVEQAMTIYREILRGEAKDLYLAVTLPGEKSFLAEAEAWKIMDEFAEPLNVDVETGRVLGVGLGDERPAVVLGLGAGAGNLDAPALTAQAGPRVIWAFSFDDDARLSDILLHSENLFRYTPYRLVFGEQLDWRVTPTAAISVFGQPDQSRRGDEQQLHLTWERPSHTVTLSFGPAVEPHHPGHPDRAAVLKLVHLHRTPAPDSAGENPALPFSNE